VKHLLLVGAGHAHIEVVRRWAQAPLPDCTLGVIDPNPRPVYSGMVPGFVAGEYRRDELEFDLESLCRRAGARYLQAAALRVDAPARSGEIGSAEPLAYDVASIDIGSRVAGAEGFADSRLVLPSRPIARLVSGVNGLVSRARIAPRFHVHVVGGGAGGVELAFCLEARLRHEGVRARVSIVSQEHRLLADGATSRSRAIARAARARGIESLLSARVRRVLSDGLELEDGQKLSSDAVLWVTGAAAHPLAAESGLPVDARGFVETTPTLEVRDRGDLFAVGDCANLAGTQRAGVYAVRSAPVLDHNLRARLAGRTLRAYRPQRDFLSILNLGDGIAVGSKWGITLSGRWMLRVKDRIDRSFMEKYR
jgi:selenide,water dikinase